jgi:F420-dependent oxidoreductase-like protein
MELRIFTEPQQGARYSDLLAVAQLAEHLGFGGFFRSDHFLPIASPPNTLPGPTEAWVTLGALARETDRIRLGTLMTSATFRTPGMLALIVAQVDEMSHGRMELGLGAGWFAGEHRAYGIAFPDVVERVDRLEEQLEIVSGMWATDPEQTYSFDGRHYSLLDCPALPKPMQRPGPPIIIGGKGRRRTPALAARFAAEFNIVFVENAQVAAAYAALDLAMDKAGRDRSAIIRSVGVVCCCGRDSDEIDRREAAIRSVGTNLGGDWVRGTPVEVAAQLNRLGELGASRVYLQILDLHDLDHLRLIADEVVHLCG